jgi:starch synthase
MCYLSDRSAFAKASRTFSKDSPVYGTRKKCLRLVGGMCHEMVRYLRKFSTPEHVEFLGHVPQPKLKEIMSRSHVMVLPSIEEGLALVQAQALACGCPVIGTPNTGADDLFTNGKEGFIVPIRDPQTIANRLQLLADSPDHRSAMSKAALQRVAQLGGWSDYGERMAGVLQELVYEKRSDKNKNPKSMI